MLSAFANTEISDSSTIIVPNVSDNNSSDKEVERRTKSDPQAYKIELIDMTEEELNTSTESEGSTRKWTKQRCNSAVIILRISTGNIREPRLQKS